MTIFLNFPEDFNQNFQETNLIMKNIHIFKFQEELLDFDVIFTKFQVIFQIRRNHTQNNSEIQPFRAFSECKTKY